MQLTTLLTASLLALGATAAATPKNPQCFTMTIWQRWRIKAADCQSAIAQINSKPNPATAGCDKVFRTEYDYATVGTCKVVVKKKTGGNPQCLDAKVVIDGIQKNLGACKSKDGQWVYDSEYSLNDASGTTITVTGSDEANDGPQ